MEVTPQTAALLLTRCDQLGLGLVQRRRLPNRMHFTASLPGRSNRAMSPDVWGPR